MRTPPEDLTEWDVGIAVESYWSVATETMEYAPAGFGSHHWVLTQRSGRRWFVTADAVADSAQRLTELMAALDTAYTLRHTSGLTFVVAPQPGRDEGLLSIQGRYAIALYPYLERVTDAPAHPQQVLSMITALHAVTADVANLATVDNLVIPDRPMLIAFLGDSSIQHLVGPYAAVFAGLVEKYHEPIRAAFDRYDAMAATIGGQGDAWVITHGEPKPNNTMITASGPVLVDWDTVQLAPPARDVWMTGSAERYTRATGRHVPPEQLDFYRLRWDLKDLCGTAKTFARPHRRTADTELSWHGAITICQRLANQR
jgi:hypothetical protein